MKCLFIYDHTVSVRGLEGSSFRADGEKCEFLPLVENSFLLKSLKEWFIATGAGPVYIHNIVKQIQKYYEGFREDIGIWADNVGEAKINERSVKEWFVLQGQSVSSWWFSLFAERNPLKTDVFLQIAKVHAIEEVLISCRCHQCLIAINDRAFRKSIITLLNKYNIHCKIIKTHDSGWIKKRVWDALGNANLLGQIIQGLFILVKCIGRGLWARNLLSSLSTHCSKGSRLLFVSYFPNIDKALAEQNIFHNKFAFPLQEMFKKMGIPVIWVLMTVGIDKYTFRDSVNLAKKFTEGGERMIIQEEFFKLRDIPLVFFMWIRQIIVAWKLYHVLRYSLLMAPPVGRECGPLVKKLWESSFYGPAGMEGIIFTLTFRRMFKTISSVNDCVYYSEMHAWERALNAARRKIAPTVRTIAYQHSIAPKNLFSYFSSARETVQSGRDTDLPLANIFATNSDIMRKWFEPCGYPGLRVLEAIRFFHINDMISLPPPKKSARPLLFVAGSIDYNETRSIISLLNTAFPMSVEFDILCKGHPSMPLEVIFDDLGIDPQKAGYSVEYGTAERYLRQASAVLVPCSSLAIQALAFNCEVIVPIFPNAINLNPLSDFCGYCRVVSSASELIEAMDHILDGENLCSVAEYRNFVKQYWCLDMALPRWADLLSERV